eukprot:7652647-Lingulodinium_polyedra.AAC.1
MTRFPVLDFARANPGMTTQEARATWKQNVAKAYPGQRGQLARPPCPGVAQATPRTRLTI